MARRSAKEAKTASEESAKAAASAREMFTKVIEERAKLLALNDATLAELRANRKHSDDLRHKLKTSEETAHAMRNLSSRFIDELRKARDEAKENAKAASESASRHENVAEDLERRPSATPLWRSTSA